MTKPTHHFQDQALRWTAQTVGMNADILDRMEQAVGKVRDRLLRATAALNDVGVLYAVVGGNAVASWVATVDEGAVRTTRDINLLVRRSDLPASAAALERAGFVRDELLDVSCSATAQRANPARPSISCSPVKRHGPIIRCRRRRFKPSTIRPTFA
jgi:hypothetical protein